MTLCQQQSLFSVELQSCETTTLEKAAENANLRKGAEDYAAAAAAVAAAVNTAANAALVAAAVAAAANTTANAAANAALAANHIFQD